MYKLSIRQVAIARALEFADPDVCLLQNSSDRTAQVTSGDDLNNNRVTYYFPGDLKILLICFYKGVYMSMFIGVYLQRCIYRDVFVGVCLYVCTYWDVCIGVGLYGCAYRGVFIGTYLQGYVYMCVLIWMYIQGQVYMGVLIEVHL